MGKQWEGILNLTQHPTSAEQLKAGVIEPCPALKKKIRELITFDELPSLDQITGRALALAGLVEGMEEEYRYAMIGGAPFFMPALEKELRAIGVTPLYAFSRREAVEENGVKKSVFRHIGFVPGLVE